MRKVAKITFKYLIMRYLYLIRIVVFSFLQTTIRLFVSCEIEKLDGSLSQAIRFVVQQNFYTFDMFKQVRIING